MDKVDWSKAPEGATHAAIVNERGRVCWYKDIIGTSAYRFMYSYGAHSDDWQSGVCGRPAHKPLEPRPQPDNKEGEGVEWEDGEYPTLGAFCEAFVDSASFDAGASAHWRSGRFHGRCCLPSSERGGLFKDDKGVLFAVPGPLYFRPIQSHRDKVIEAVRKAMGKDDPGFYTLFAIYNVGALKLPEGEE